MPPSSRAFLFRPVLLSCFFLSGAAGLIYQVAWGKSLGLIFGNTAYAVTTVLIVFMGGLAAGSDFLGRWSERCGDPTRLYAWMEIAIAGFGALSLIGLAGVRGLYIYAFPVIATSSVARIALRVVASALVLGIPTFLMGGTLPVLVRALQQDDELPSRFSRLYWVNTAGAVIGTLWAGFLLLPAFGLQRTIITAAALNLTAGVFALAAARLKVNEKSSANRATASKSAKIPANRLLLFAFGAVGATAMAYEISWTRLLAIMLGSSTYAFTLMLATFLAGIAIGSALFERWSDRGPRITWNAFAATQSFTAATALGFLILFGRLPEMTVSLLRGSAPAFGGILLAQSITSIAAMLPAAICFGFNFPLATSLIAGPRDQKMQLQGESAMVGRACAANTLGAIVGAALAGFVLLPQIGAYRLVGLAAGVNVLLAFLLIFLGRKASSAALGVNFALAVALIAVVFSGAFYRRDLSDFGILLYYPLHPSGVTPEEMAGANDVLFSEDGRNATVAVLRSEDYLSLSIDGKIDASNRDVHTQRMLGDLGALLHPHPVHVLVIGFGSGMTVASLARFSEITTIDCVEIEPAVVHAAPYLEKLNGGILHDPRVHIIFDDARNFLLTTRERFDLIVSEPSNPWIAGVSALYTREFYRDARKRLLPGGMFVQWVQAYSLFPADLQMVIRTYSAEFDRVTLWRGEPYDFLLLGQTNNEPLSLARAQTVWTHTGLASDFRALGLTRPEGLLAYEMLEAVDLQRLAASSSASATLTFSTDDRMPLEFDAPRAVLAGGLGEQNRQEAISDRTSVLPVHISYPNERDALFGAAETAIAIEDWDRAKPFLEALETKYPSTDAAILRGRFDLQQALYAAARISFETALRLDPQSVDAKVGVAQSLIGLKDFDSASQILQFVLERESHRREALEAMAELSAAKGNWADAAQWLERRIAEDTDPSCRDVAELGRFELRTGDRAKGEAALNRALSFDGYCYPAHRTLAELYIAERQWQQAREHLEEIVRYAPEDDVTAYGALAGVYRALGNRDASIATLRKGLRIFPGDANLARLLQSQ